MSARLVALALLALAVLLVALAWPDRPPSSGDALSLAAPGGGVEAGATPISR